MARHAKTNAARKPLEITASKLDIGSGGNRRDVDYTTVDLFHPEADLKCPMWEIPVPDNSIEAIWSEHSLEHVAVGEVHKTLKEWLRVLKPGATAIISVPNFDYVARYWLTGADRPWAEAMVFGNQAHAGEFHKCAFTAAGIKADCEAAGFEVVRVEIRWSHSQETLQCVAMKPKGNGN
jgi:SAM-dependent methyltransferase